MMMQKGPIAQAPAVDAAAAAWKRIHDRAQGPEQMVNRSEEAYRVARSPEAKRQANIRALAAARAVVRIYRLELAKALRAGASPPLVQCIGDAMEQMEGRVESLTIAHNFERARARFLRPATAPRQHRRGDAPGPRRAARPRSHRRPRRARAAVVVASAATGEPAPSEPDPSRALPRLPARRCP